MQDRQLEQARANRARVYDSYEYRDLLACHGFKGRHRKGDCWDNAVMKRVWRRQYANHNKAIYDVVDYIVKFCDSR